MRFEREPPPSGGRRGDRLRTGLARRRPDFARHAAVHSQIAPSEPESPVQDEPAVQQELLAKQTSPPQSLHRYAKSTAQLRLN